MNSIVDPLLEDDPISRLLLAHEGKKDDDIPFKLVKPTAGFCVKTHTLEGDKIFMNICYTDDIPEPEDISDAELINILESDEPSSFRVPMSIGNLHVEADKGGNLCSAYDIAINTRFFSKVYTNELFKTFFLTVVMEGLQEKYNLQLTLQDPKPYRIVKNRKCLGKLQMHRIQQRPVKKPPTPLIQVISSSTYSDDQQTISKGIIDKRTKNKLRLITEIDTNNLNKPKLIEEIDTKSTSKPKLITGISDLNRIDESNLVTDITNTKITEISESKPKIIEIPRLDEINKCKINEISDKDMPTTEREKKIGDFIDKPQEPVSGLVKTELKLTPPVSPTKHPMAVDDVKKVRLFGVPNNEAPEKIVAFIKFSAESAADISLDISEVRVAVSNRQNSNFIDFNIPVKVNPQKVIANFCVNLQVLKLILPLIQDDESVMAID